MSTTPFRVLRRFVRAAEGDSKPKAKRMVLMIGPPAAGKGFFVGETENYDQKDVEKGKAKPDEVGKAKRYKTQDGEEKSTRAGYKLPESTHGLFQDADIPDAPEADESDNHLRAIQFDESKHHYDTLRAAHEKGKKAFDAALADLWYETKDGDRVELGKVSKLTYEDFPNDHRGFFGKTNKSFYVSMRGWHDDAKHVNSETGKPKERFKDEARHRFDDAIQRQVNKDSDLLIVDSAGEDIDAQDFRGQIEDAKANGYEVSVVFLHPEQADTELSNLSRGKVAGKRMVDQADIDNWYKQNEAALQEIQKAKPHNFLHYRKGPPDKDPAKAAELRARARDLMNGLADMPEGDEKNKATKEIASIVYIKSPYELQEKTSWATTLPAAKLPKEPEGDVAEVVAKMNEEADRSADKFPDARVRPKKSGPAKERRDKDDSEGSRSKGKGDEDKSRTRMDFLHEVGDKLVPNPNPDGRKKQIKIRSLPWEQQKRYYEQWSKQASTLGAISRRVYARYIQAQKGPVAMAEEKRWLAGWRERLAKQIESDVQVKGYKLTAEALSGPIVSVTIEGAEGDATTARDAREQLDKLLSEVVSSEMKGYKGFSHKIRSANHGDDLVLTCEVIFP